jgi:hypothetical protein
MQLDAAKIGAIVRILTGTSGLFQLHFTAIVVNRKLNQLEENDPSQPHDRTVKKNLDS